MAEYMGFTGVKFQSEITGLMGPYLELVFGPTLQKGSVFGWYVFGVQMPPKPVWKLRVLEATLKWILGHFPESCQGLVTFFPEMEEQVLESRVKTLVLRHRKKI